MNWYYVEAGNQAGPVTGEELQRLVNIGTIQPNTLVWREGMSNWQPYRIAGPGTDQSPPSSYAVSEPGAGGLMCAECGGFFSQDSVIQYGNSWICANCKPAFMQKLREGAALPGEAAHVRFGGFWIRVAAKFIDGLILMVVLGIPIGILFFRYMGASTGGTGDVEMAAVAMQVLIQVLAVGAAVTFNTFFLGRYGATPGKMACGLKVVMPDGSRLTYMRAFGRAWAEQLSGMICYIGYIMVAFDKEKRGLHDHICNTRVIWK